MPAFLLLMFISVPILASLSLDLDILVLFMVLFGAVAALSTASADKEIDILSDETPGETPDRHTVERIDPRSQASGGASHGALEFSRF